MTHDSKIYVAKSPSTGLYMVRVLDFFHDNQGWVKAASPTDEEIKEQLLLSDYLRSKWTDNMNNADIWDDYSIKNYSRYLPVVDFIEVHISTTSV